MPATTVKKVMQQRLIRGTPVIVADSFGHDELRGKKVLVASKTTVKCNKGTRCAGYWCAGLAVFVTKIKPTKKVKKTKTRGRGKKAKAKEDMGWRGGTTKICITHLKDKDGVLILPPPLDRQPAPKADYPSRLDLKVIEAPEALAGTNGDGRSTEVTWIALSHAVQSGDLEQIAFMARALKSENDLLKSKVILAQDRLLAQLTG